MKKYLFGLLLLLVVGCTSEYKLSETPPKYVFTPGSIQKYRVNIKAEYFASAFGFKVKGAPSLKFDIFLVPIRKLGAIYRVHIVVANLVARKLPKAGQRMLAPAVRFLKRWRGFSLFITEQGELLSWQYGKLSPEDCPNWVVQIFSSLLMPLLDGNYSGTKKSVIALPSYDRRERVLVSSETKVNGSKIVRNSQLAYVTSFANKKLHAGIKVEQNFSLHKYGLHSTQIDLSIKTAFDIHKGFFKVAVPLRIDIQAMVERK